MARRVTGPSGVVASAMWREIFFGLGSMHLGWLGLYAASASLIPENGQRAMPD